MMRLLLILSLAFLTAQCSKTVAPEDLRADNPTKETSKPDDTEQSGFCEILGTGDAALIKQVIDNQLATYTSTNWEQNALDFANWLEQQACVIDAEALLNQIETLPIQTEIDVRWYKAGNQVDEIIDIWVPDAKPMNFHRTHE